jgi:hypothetical protein
MKNYYFDNDLNLLVEDEVDDCEKVSYAVVNDVEKFKAFCDKICMIDYGVTSTEIYYFNFNEEEWQELDEFISLPIYDVLDKYINKTEDDAKENNTKENSTMDNKEKTFNFSIEFKNGGFISEENCNKSFDEIINSVKDLYNSAVFGGNVKKITIEMN